MPFAARSAAFCSLLLLGACSTAPVTPFVVEIPAGVIDGRARFNDIFCAVLEQHGAQLPDNRTCDGALSPVASAPIKAGLPVDVGRSRSSLIARAVPGIGYACIAPWLHAPATIRAHLAKSGYDLQMVGVDALSGIERNARQIRDAIMAMQYPAGPPGIVLIGYSKGVPDALEAIVKYPELQQRVAAFVSIAGAVGGSPLANDAKQPFTGIFTHWPQAECDPGDGGALDALRPEVRKAWLAANRLPPGIRYYSLVTLPDRERISRAIEPAYDKLARIDPRNDGQLIYSDQIIPGSTLLGFLNADHWAVFVPIDRTHDVIGSTLVNHNDYPREALMEALLRYMEEDLAVARP
ncbi:MAG: lipase family protein [Gammaproteobacteria bacterium]|nr:lipase family protein [Gammaproteobacteria bacterium]MDH5175220.1 lipase family protein [Gammaproteobacteria bacterium]